MLFVGRTRQTTQDTASGMHQAAERYTLARDEIQGRFAALDDIHDCVVMICQVCGLDKQKKELLSTKSSFFVANEQ